ncbi:MAG: 50S ribosomal protein L6 [Draconibacterium sp.]|nr:50S ribosomal protein L6 [Draconibacterium sp.]
MSRIGLKPIVIPEKVQVNIKDGIMTAKVPLGELKVNIPNGIGNTIENNILVFSRENQQRKTPALHGLCRSLCANAIEGVATGFKKSLIIEGVGFKSELRGKADRILFSLGFSHSVLVIAPDGIKFEIPKANNIIISGIDKQLVGEVAAKIRKLRKPEPYKGKGIRYEGEYIRRKAGKTAA